jgi:hypothetical protein
VRSFVRAGRGRDASEWRVSTHCSRFPDDKGWTAIDPSQAIRTGFLLLPTARGRSISVLPARKVASAKSTRVSMFARTGAFRVFRTLSLGLEPKPTHRRSAHERGRIVSAVSGRPFTHSLSPGASSMKAGDRGRRRGAAEEWRHNTDHRVEIMALSVGQLSVDR